MVVTDDAPRCTTNYISLSLNEHPDDLSTDMQEEDRGDEREREDNDDKRIAVECVSVWSPIRYSSNLHLESGVTGISVQLQHRVGATTSARGTSRRWLWGSRSTSPAMSKSSLRRNVSWELLTGWHWLRGAGRPGYWRPEEMLVAQRLPAERRERLRDGAVVLLTMVAA